MSEIPMLKESQLIEYLPGYVWWKDMSSVFLKTNANTARLLGFKHAEDLVGITDYEVLSKAAAEADYRVGEDKKVQSNYATMSFLNVTSFTSNDVTVLLVNKSLFFDENSKPLGIAGQGIELNRRVLNDMPLLSKEFSTHRDRKTRTTYYLNGEYGDIKLSTRQAQCLFYVLRGKTSKVIARILQLSNRTVESYIDDIKVKIRCQNKAELIEKSFDLGFLEIIPAGDYNSSIYQKPN